MGRYFVEGSISGQQDFQSDWWKDADTYQQLLMLAPRDHAKTTNLGIWYPIYRLCKWRWLKRKNPNLPDPRIGLLSNTEGQAEGLCRAITLHLTGNDKIIEDFGKWKPDAPTKWTTLELIVDGWKAPNRKDSTVFAGGYGSAWLGRRIDLLIADDVVDLKLNSGTEDARLQLLTWWREVIRNCLEASGQTIMIGTMQHHKDLYNTIIHEERERARIGDPHVWTVRKYRAVIQDETPTSPARVLWPEKNPYTHLMLRRSDIGSAAFEKQFQNKAVNEDLLCFQSRFLKGPCLDKTGVIGQVGEGWKVYIGVDPALGQSGLAKFFVMMAIGVEPLTKRIHIIDVLRDKLSVTKQLSWIGQWNERYSPMAVVIETNAYQDALRQLLKKEFPFMRVRGQFTHKNKIDPEIGVVSMMAPMVENGMLQLPYGNPESVRKTDRLIDELTLWPEGEYTDQVMALWIACSGAREQGAGAFSKPGIWGTSVHNPVYPPRPTLSTTAATLQSLDPVWNTPETDPHRGGRLPSMRS